MPLYDLSSLKNDPNSWTQVHTMWTAKIVDYLNGGALPAPYQAMPTLHVGIRAEIDIATAKPRLPTAFPNGVHRNGTPSGFGGGGGVATAVATKTYAPPKAALSANVEFAETEAFEVQIQRKKWGVVAAIELVSPANKDRPASRATFVTKCASYLSAGVSLVVVDAVSERLADLHGELCELLRLEPAFAWQSESGLSAICYRTVQGCIDTKSYRSDGTVRMDVWPHELKVGEELPTVPLWLAVDLAIPLELESTYRATCQSLRIGE